VTDKQSIYGGSGGDWRNDALILSSPGSGEVNGDSDWSKVGEH
jgi:hypothetical protein